LLVSPYRLRHRKVSRHHRFFPELLVSVCNPSTPSWAVVTENKYSLSQGLRPCMNTHITLWDGIKEANNFHLRVEIRFHLDNFIIIVGGS
jgi:hypothetical protein